MAFRSSFLALVGLGSLLLGSCQNPANTTVVQAPTATVRDANIGSVSSIGGAAVAPLSWSHTVAAGQNRLLIVAITKRSTTEMSSVTFGSAALTRLAKSEGQGNTARVELWYLLNPAEGTDTITATNELADHWHAFAMDLSGVNQSTPFGTPASVVGTTENPSLVVSSAANDLVLDVVCYERGGLSNDQYAVGTGQILKAQRSLSGDNWSGALSTEAGASSVTMSWSRSQAGQNWAQLAVGIKPAP